VEKQVTRSRLPGAFNSPLEAGVRVVSLLDAAYPRSYDLQRLIGLDYLLVHTGDIGGPSSLHPPTPLRSAELLVRRKLIEQALLLMMTRELVEREITANGISYRAGENASPFLSSLQEAYIQGLKTRAAWLHDRLGALNEVEFRAVIRRFFDEWVEEFESAEKSLGVSS
jgi:hypothetical protein